MAVKFYTSFTKKLLDNDIDLASDTIKAAFVTSSYTPNQGTHDYWDDVSTNEVSASGSYSAGGITLANKTTTAGTLKTTFDFDDLVATSFTGTFRYVVFYKSTGTDGTSALIGYDDLTSVTVTSGTFTYNVNASGLLEVTIS